ncbi:hypothetical protein RU93_GL000714 [Enterococcus aquimarinus]|uniref:Uncharacterized protein n=1 Tax=Enterococcus aquimarinus TaxID=328396 RepID=A0A1L8QPW9_9ENTE|nr:hypothetical protein RU93_GL000714 [Enterococcus aquimarinus]
MTREKKKKETKIGLLIFSRFGFFSESQLFNTVSYQRLLQKAL